jgi:hypothetical protein
MDNPMPQAVRRLLDLPWRVLAGAATLAWLAGLLLTGCKPSDAQQARTLVERYNKAVSEAYRRSDARLIEPVVGLREGKKLTGLIGVRSDFGLALDSHLLALEVNRVEREQNVMRVSTRERWRYRNLRLGSGEQVGEESFDSYDMLYIFTNSHQTWLVDEIRFTKPPWIGRAQNALVADQKTAPATPTNSTPQPERIHP